MSSKKITVAKVEPNPVDALKAVLDENNLLKTEITKLLGVDSQIKALTNTLNEVAVFLAGLKRVDEVMDRNSQLEAFVEKMHGYVVMAGVGQPFKPEVKAQDMYWIILEDLAEDTAKLRKVV